MRALVGGLVFLVVIMSLSFPVKGLNVTDTVFTQGVHFQTESNGENLTLAFEYQPVGEYYLGGNYTSLALDAGFVVDWTTISWIADLNLTAGNVVKLQTRTGNSTPPDPTWEGFSQNYTTSGGSITSGMSRYIQFVSWLETGDNTSTPILEEVVLSYDLIPPVVSLDLPVNGFNSLSPNITFNCSASSVNNLENITFFSDLSGAWGAGGTVQVSGNQAVGNFTVENIADGGYSWNCRAADETDQEVFHSINYTIIVAATDPPPTIASYSITPNNVAVGTDVELTINATDNVGVDAVWAVITLPNSSTVTITLINNGVVNYTAEIEGDHAVAFHANDTLGQESTATGAFSVSPEIIFTVNVTDSNQTGVEITLTLLLQGMVVASFSSDGGNISETVLSGVYDLEFSSFSGELRVRLEGVDLATESGKTLGLDKISGGVYGVVTYGVDNTYAITGGRVTLTYDDNLFLNEEFIILRVCSNWNFQAQGCSGDFQLVGSFVHDMDANTFEFNVTGFSAFSLDDQGFCGDGVCSGGEDQSSCPQDCQCFEGQQQQCGTTDLGECVFGLQTCVNGQWGGCVGEIEAQPELCNQEDDDCDGIVDNVNGESSIEATQCQCFLGLPLEEVCNNIDDDCDGLVDQFSRPCGSNIGICQEGAKTCIAGVFQGCVGGRDAELQEICKNSLDDNCNGETDESCPDCNNGIQDGNEEGVDCGGSCGECPQFPFALLSVIGIIILVVVFVFLKFRKRPTWKKLERRYSYKPPS